MSETYQTHLKRELLKLKTALKKLIKIPIRTCKEKLKDLADMIAMFIIQLIRK